MASTKRNFIANFSSDPQKQKEFEEAYEACLVEEQATKRICLEHRANAGSRANQKGALFERGANIYKLLERNGFKDKPGLAKSVYKTLHKYGPDNTEYIFTTERAFTSKGGLLDALGVLPKYVEQDNVGLYNYKMKPDAIFVIVSPSGRHLSFTNIEMKTQTSNGSCVDKFGPNLSCKMKKLFKHYRQIPKETFVHQYNAYLFDLTDEMKRTAWKTWKTDLQDFEEDYNISYFLAGDDEHLVKIIDFVGFTTVVSVF